VELTAKLGYRHIHTHERLRRKSAKAADNLGIEAFDLTFEEGTALGHLSGLRIPVTRRAALEDVTDVHVVSLDSDRLDDLGQKLAGPPHEGDTLPVFVRPWSLANEYEAGIGTPAAENDIGASARQLTTLTVSKVFPYLIQ